LEPTAEKEEVVPTDEPSLPAAVQAVKAASSIEGQAQPDFGPAVALVLAGRGDDLVVAAAGQRREGEDGDEGLREFIDNVPAFQVSG